MLLSIQGIAERQAHALGLPSLLGHGFGQSRKPAAQKLRRCKQRIDEDYLLYPHKFRSAQSDLSHKAADSQAILLFCSLP